MVSCTSCGSDVTGKKFCPQCGTPTRPINPPMVNTQACPRCNGTVNVGTAFCMHCGASLSAQAMAVPTPPPPPQTCPACHTMVTGTGAFCTNCGHNLRLATAQSAPALHCTNCGRSNAPGVRFCAGCGTQLVGNPTQTNYTQYPQSQYVQPSQYPPSQYVQPVPYSQPSGQSYQPQPLLGQQPMALRCPTCMALAPMGATNCSSCRTSLAGVVPMPANAPMQKPQGGFLQSGGGQLAIGALGGAAAVIGGQALFHGMENIIEDRVEENLGLEGRHHHNHHEGGLLGGLGELADDIGLI